MKAYKGDKIVSKHTKKEYTILEAPQKGILGYRCKDDKGEIFHLFENEFNIKETQEPNFILEKIKSEDLIFSNELEDDRTNTYLHLYDYDWMTYSLSTKFCTKNMGVLEVDFQYYGFTISRMKIVQTCKNKTREIIYEYPTEIFQKYIIKFLEKHIKAWNDEYAFNGEEEVINFFNEVLEVGNIIE